MHTIAPYSSAITGKIKSVCESGIYFFIAPSPGPFPNSPPSLYALIDFSTWKFTVSELKKLPSYLVHEPWKVNFLEEKEYNFDLKKNYIHPIIDNKKNTKDAKEKMWKIKKLPESKEICEKIINKHASLKRSRNER